MVNGEFIIVAIVICTFVYIVVSQIRNRRRQKELPADDNHDLYKIAEELEQYSAQAALPIDLLEHEAFRRGVKVLKDGAYSTQDLLAYYTGENANIAWMALEALAQRDDEVDISLPVLEGLNNSTIWTLFFALRALNARVDQPIVGQVLVRLDDSFDDINTVRILKDFIAKRIDRGEQPSFANLLAKITEEQFEFLDKVIHALGKELAGGLMKELMQWRTTQINFAFLQSFGRLLQPSDQPEQHSIILHDQLLVHVATLEAALQKEPPTSIIMVGESGVGKTAILTVLTERLQKQGWIIFEASSTDLLAGQVYIGELEQRLQSLVQYIGGKRKLLWIVPDFQNLLWAGRHRYSQTSVLDYILPYLERGEITLIGETQPVSYERLLQMKPALRTAVETHRIQPLSKSETLVIAQQWVQLSSKPDAAPLCSDQTLQEAAQLTQQYLGDKALPGNLLLFLKLTYSRLSAGKITSAIQITLDDLLVTLIQLTGLPASILDDRQSLDLTSLQEFFHKRVFGQPEAIECLVQRIAMIKAGLTDPTRPQGVFLFVGPTGTGKTEIAKTLAEFLFGSPDRMIRLDMSEFHLVGSVDRILGDPHDQQQKTALVNHIRNQPFSVVLLDEFEKAHATVWDLFLQVFDDGRLTDSLGNVADFRHCIIIMTSNLGANIPYGTTIGFDNRDYGFTTTGVERAVGQVFRKEFLNRIDRVVVFRPLGPGAMRELLYKELDQVLHRRGLRSRSWAVEWDDSAIEFLLKQGFTPDLGARPLKRAVDRYLLSPLAITIVNHQFPEGDQFLFVRSDGEKIQVEFIDPDAPELKPGMQEKPGQKQDRQPESELRLEKIILEAQGTLAEVQFLQQHYDFLVTLVADDDWQQKKQQALAQMSSPEFWTSNDRFSILGLAEYMDRIEAGLRTAGSLLERSIGLKGEKRQQFSRELLHRLAQHLYLIDAAYTGFEEGHPRDAFLLIEANKDSGPSKSTGYQYAGQLGRMYRRWAKKRGMELQELEKTTGDEIDSFRLLFAISGYAAYTILKPESGLHVFQLPRDKQSHIRYKIRVRVVPQPDEPAGHEPGALLVQARRILASFEDTNLSIVRRYREEPSPLVRDSVRNWKTGNLNRVLDGDFDVMC